jgi:hypothetical protein
MSSPRLLDSPGRAVVATGTGAEWSTWRSARMAGESELGGRPSPELRVESCIVVSGPQTSERDTRLGRRRE